MTVLGASFVGRTIELRWLAQALRSGHALLLGPRRFGKTSVMQEHLARCITETGLYMDVEQLGEPADFVLALARHLAETPETADALLASPIATRLDLEEIARSRSPVERAERLEGSLDRLRPELATRWSSVGEDLIRAVSHRRPALVIGVDELPFMLDRMARHQHQEAARTLLNWLRALRADTGLRNVHWIFGGSIGMDALAKRLGLEATLNDLKRIYIGPMRSKEAGQLITQWERTSKMRLGPDLRRIVLGVMREPVPFFLNMFLGFLHDERRKIRRRLSRDDVQRVYVREMLGAHMSVHLEPYVTRLEQYFPPEKSAAARAVLAALAVRGELTEVEMRAIAAAHVQSGLDRAFADLLASLSGDYYITQGEANRYHFTVHLLRDWWRRNVGEG